jgi:hypothetical protein
MKDRVRVEIELVEDLIIADGRLAMAALVRVEAAAPAQDEHLPYGWELISQTAGLQLMRKMFCAGMEKSDLELIWSLHTSKGGAEFVRMGKRHSKFKTLFGTVLVARIRIKYRESGKSETPSSKVWKLKRQVTISRGLKNAICNTVAKESFDSTRQQIARQTGEAGIVSKSTIGNILRQEGGRLALAQQARAEKVIKADSVAQALLGRAAVHIAEKYFEDIYINGAELESESDAKRAFDQIRWDPYQELIKQAEQERENEPGEQGAQGAQNNCAVVTDRDTESEPIAGTGAEVDKEIAAGVAAGAAAGAKEAAAKEQIIAQVDEVVIAKQPGGKRDRVVHYNGSVKNGEQTFYCSGSTSAQLISQMAAVLAQMGLEQGEKSLLVLSDCASWITNWVSGIGIEEKEAVLCWWHLRDKCRELVGEAFTNRDDRAAVRKIILKYLWRGQTDKALKYLKQLIADVEDGQSKLMVKGIAELVAIKSYLIKRQQYIPDYQARRKRKEWIASTQIEKFNDLAISARCKGQGRRWSSAGVQAIAALETARRNGELASWQEQGQLPGWPRAA